MMEVESQTLQAGDADSITIFITTECVPLDLTQYNFFWELKKTLSSTPILQKTDVGSEYLPAGVTPDVEVDYTENSVTIFLTENETEEFYGKYVQYLYVRNKANNDKKSILYGYLAFMENPSSPYPAVTYTTPELVADQLRMVDPSGDMIMFSEDTDPKRSVVIEFIKQAEANIDRNTRNSWKSNSIIDELHDIAMPLAGLPLRDVVVSLRKSNILPWDILEGDNLSVFQTGTWVDYSTATQVMQGNSWWLDKKIGQVHFNDFWPWFFNGTNRVKISYRWGDTANGVPDDIIEATTKMVCIRILQSEFNKIFLYNRNSNPINWNNVIQYWQKDIERIIANHKRRNISIVTR